MFLTHFIFQVIREPYDVTTCEGQGAVFTCVLNNNIRSDDAQWYRFIEDDSTTVMVDSNGENINFLTSTNGSITYSWLTITNATKSYTGYYWLRTSSGDVCNASLTVTTSPSALNVTITKDLENSLVVLQWDEVDDYLNTLYSIVWGNHPDHVDVVQEVTSYTITGLTLDTVYTITVVAANMCGQGLEFRTSVTLSPDIISTTVTSTAVIVPNSAHLIIMTTAVTPLGITGTILCNCTTTTAMADPNTITGKGMTHDSGLSNGAVAGITFIVTSIVSVTVTAIITFIVTYICIKRKLKQANAHFPKHPSPGPHEKALYEEMCLPSHTVTKIDLDLRPVKPDPAYDTSNEVIMDTNPAYEICKL